MGSVVIDMSMSLDGYIAAPNDTPEQGNPDTIDVLTDVVKHLTVPW